LNLPAVRDKLHLLKRDTAERFARLQRELESVSNALAQQDERLAGMESRLEALARRIGKPDSGATGAVNDLASLREFIIGRFGEAWLVLYRDDGLTSACMQVRDALAETQPHIERLNDQADRHGYTAPAAKHADAFYWFDGAAWRIVDFCIASDSPGSLAAQLCWRIEERTPWKTGEK
jgi:hypothetical protein